MKKIIVLLLVFITCSCSLEDETPQNYHEFLPIESVILPSEFVLNEAYGITVNYIKLTSCHTFNDFFTAQEGNEIKVVVINTVSRNNCNTLNEEIEATFNFTPTEVGSYIFKFWQGQDNTGEDNYMTMEVPVVE